MSVEENGFEASFDLEPESVENLKSIIYSEVEEVSKRFNQGKETLDDLMNNYRHLKIRFELKNEKEQELEVVELKYYKKLIEEIKKQKKIINDMAEYMEEEFAEYQLDYIYEKVHNVRTGMERNWTRGKEAEIKDILKFFTNKYEEGKNGI